MMYSPPQGLLTANGAPILVATITAPVPARADNRGRAAPSIGAAHRAVVPAPRRRTAQQLHEKVRHGTRTAQVRRFVASIPAGHDRIAVLVLGQTLPAAAHERVLRAFARLAEIAPNLVLAVRALGLSVADAGPRYAAAALFAPERQLRTGGRPLLLGTVHLQREITLLIGRVATIRTAIAHEEPADADSTRAALK